MGSVLAYYKCDVTRGDFASRNSDRLTCNLVVGLTRTKLHAVLDSGNELRNSETRHVTPANVMQESKVAR